MTKTKHPPLPGAMRTDNDNVVDLVKAFSKALDTRLRRTPLMDNAVSLAKVFSNTLHTRLHHFPFMDETFDQAMTRKEHTLRDTLYQKEADRAMTPEDYITLADLDATVLLRIGEDVITLDSLRDDFMPYAMRSHKLSRDLAEKAPVLSLLCQPNMAMN